MHDRFVKPATCTNGGHSHNVVVIIDKGAIYSFIGLLAYLNFNSGFPKGKNYFTQILII